MLHNKFHSKVIATLFVTLSLTQVGMVAAPNKPRRLPQIPLTRGEQLRDWATRCGKYVAENPKAMTTAVSFLPTFILIGLSYRYWDDIKKLGFSVRSSVSTWQNTGEATSILSRDLASYVKGETNGVVPESFQHLSALADSPEAQKFINRFATALIGGAFEAKSRGASRRPSRAQTPFQPINPTDLQTRLNAMAPEGEQVTPGSTPREESSDFMTLLFSKYLATPHGRMLANGIAATAVQAYLQHQPAPVDSGVGLGGAPAAQDNPFELDKIVAALAPYPQLAQGVAAAVVTAAVTANPSQVPNAELGQVVGDAIDDRLAVITQQDHKIVRGVKQLSTAVRNNPYSSFIFLYALALGTTRAFWDNPYVLMVFVATSAHWGIKMLAYTPLDGITNRLRARGRQRAQLQEFVG